MQARTWADVELEELCADAGTTCEFMQLAMPVNVDGNADVWAGLTRLPALGGLLSCTLFANSDLIREEEGCAVLPGVPADSYSTI